VKTHPHPYRVCHPAATFATNDYRPILLAALFLGMGSALCFVLLLRKTENTTIKKAVQQPIDAYSNVMSPGTSQPHTGPALARTGGPGNKRARILLRVFCSVLLVACFGGVVLLGLDWVISRGDIEKNRESRAKIDVKMLEKAVKIFFDSNGRYPDKLDELAATQTGSSHGIVPTEALEDPWRQPYHYDLAKRHPVTGMPLIYSQGPPGHNKRFYNWPPD
jgi:hypothetical protein